MTSPAVADAIQFDDGAAYERFMGRWSRAAGALFLEWLAPPAEARWLEIGCGTGAFTQLVSGRCRPAAIVAFDPAPEQIAYARRHLRKTKAAFHVATAEAMPFTESCFDVVVSALAVNFMRNRVAGVREMRRVSCAGGTIAGYVWDFVAKRMPNGPLVRAMHRLGIDVPSPPGADVCSLEALRALFARADLSAIEATVVEIDVSFPDFTAFWAAQTPHFSPITRQIERLNEPQRSRLEAALRSELPIQPDGRIAYPARAYAVKTRVP